MYIVIGIIIGFIVGLFVGISVEARYIISALQRKGYKISPPEASDDR